MNDDEYWVECYEILDLEFDALQENVDVYGSLHPLREQFVAARSWTNYLLYLVGSYLSKGA